MIEVKKVDGSRLSAEVAPLGSAILNELKIGLQRIGWSSSFDGEMAA